MRYAICSILLASLAFHQYAGAQVFKCAGVGGKVIYSDKPCDQNTSGGMLLRERTLEEKIQEREQAYDAEIRKQDRRMAEQERELAEQYKNEISNRRAMREQQYQPQHQGYEERLRERNAGVKSRYEQPKTSAQRRVDPASNLPPNKANQSPSSITHCAGGFCYDNMGGVYHDHNNGKTMTGQNGGTCVQIGGMLQCN